MARVKSIIRTDNATGRVVDAVLTVPTQAVSVTPTPRTIGLGDLAATFAKPIAAAIDAITEHVLTEDHKTALANCPACSRRHNKLNLLCPDILICPFLGKLLELLPSFAREALLEAAKKHAAKPNP